MKEHLGVTYSWDKDKHGPKVVATMNNLIQEIISMTEEHLGTPVHPRKIPTPNGYLLEEGTGDEK